MKALLEKAGARLRFVASKLWCPERRQKIVHSRINGYGLLVLANEDVGRQIHFVGRFEEQETDYLRRTVGADWTCVDIGANVGYFTMLLAQAAHGGKVHAFEPLPLNVALLKASTEINGFTNVHMNECAVSDADGMVSFSQAADSAYSSMLDTSRKPVSRLIRVAAVRLDDYLDREGILKIDFLKADVEGAEGLVLGGATRLLDDDKRKPRLILMELYEDNLKTFGTSVGAVLAMLARYGYDPFVINGRGEKTPFTEDMKAAYYNVFFSPADRHA